MKRQIMVPALAIAIVGTSLFGVSSIFAQSIQNPESSIVQKIAERFNLKTDDVQAVFDQYQSEHHAEMEKKYEEQLTQYVKEGKITEAQKKLILDKRAEMEKQREASLDSDENLTPAQRKSQMEERRSELEAWAKENGIDPQYLMVKIRMGGHMKFGHGPN